MTSSTDVIDDTRNTFIKSYDDDKCEKETQLDELMRCRDAFNWSDDELLEKRETNRKGKHNKANLPKVNGGKGQSLSMQAYSQIKSAMSGKQSQGTEFQIKRRKSDGDGGLCEL